MNNKFDEVKDLCQLLLLKFHQNKEEIGLINITSIFHQKQIPRAYLSYGTAFEFTRYKYDLQINLSFNDK